MTSDTDINGYCQLQCELHRLNVYKKKLSTRKDFLIHLIEYRWKSLGVMSTKQSSWFYHDSNIPNINNMGNRFGRAGRGIQGVHDAVDVNKMYLSSLKEQYKKYNEWYKFINRYTAKRAIETCKEDIRLFSLLIKRYNNGPPLAAATKEYNDLKDEICKLGCQIQNVERKLSEWCEDECP